MASFRPAVVAATAISLAALTSTAGAVESLQAGATALIGRPAGFGALPDDSVYYASAQRRSVSKDGRYVVFESGSDGMSPDDVNTRPNVFVRDLQTNTTTLVDRATGANGAAADEGASRPSISGDGTKVVFVSYATNLGASGYAQRVYVRDLQADTTSIVSCDTATNCTPETGDEPSINYDGTKIAFTSSSANLAPDTTSGADVFVRNTTTHVTTLVSRATGAAGAQASGSADWPSISESGTRVAFQTTSALDPTDTHGGKDVYIRDTGANITRWVSHGTQATNGGYPSISGDGLYVGFETNDAFDAVHDVDGSGDVYLWSYPSDTFTLESRPTGASTTSDNGDARFAAVNSNGSAVAFVSTAVDLGDGATDQVQHVHVRSGTTTTLIDRADGAAGAPASSYSQAPSIDGAGTTVEFENAAGNLVPGFASSDNSRILVRDTSAQTTRVVSVPTGAPSPASDGQVSYDDLAVSVFGQYDDSPTSGGNPVSDDGRYVVFSSYSDGLMSTDLDGGSNVYLRDVVTGALTLVSQSTSGQPADGDSINASLSADGTHVAFESTATNLGAPAGTSSAVYVRDLVHGTTTVASRADGASGAVPTGAFGTSIDADGNRVAFLTGTSLDPKDTYNGNDVYERDLSTNTTVLISRKDGANTTTGNDQATLAAVDGDGNRVAFVDNSTNLGDGTTAAGHVHVRDLSGNSTTLVDRVDGQNGAVANGAAYNVSIDRAGNRVAFDSYSSNLAADAPVSSDPEYTPSEAYVRDVAAGTTVMASRAAGASGAPIGGNGPSRISSDGRHVVMPAYQPPGPTAVYERDLDAGTTTLASAPDGQSTTSDGARPGLSADGRCVAFLSHEPLTSPGYHSTDFVHVYLRVLSGECPSVAPDTRIDSGPPATTTDATPAFAFSADESGTTFACSFDGGAFASCTSPTTSTALALGAHSFAVRATDRAGQADATPASAAFSVVHASGGSMSVSGLSVSPSRFAVAPGATAVSAAKHAHRGTTIAYTLSARASTTLTFARRAAGRRKGKSCVRPARATKHAKRCTRLVAAGVLRRGAASGHRTVAFTGRIGKHALAPGSYVVSVRAGIPGGVRSKPVSKRFTVVRA